MNKVIELGRLVADPELKYTSNNTPCCKFKIAVNRGGKKVEGQPTADFFTITAWKQTAEFVQKYFTKGQQVLVEGSLRNNNYTDKNGQKHFTNDIHATAVYFADSKRDRTTADESTYQSEPSTYQNPPMNEDGSELPF